MGLTRNCIICGTKTSELFRVKIFGVDRLLTECRNDDCGHAQFDRVDWLEKAYSKAISGLDTGAVRRCLSISVKIVALITARIFCPRGSSLVMLDYGGGAGLLTRILRDVGVNCYSYDKYCENVYSSAFNGSKGEFDLISMIELLEHLENPIDELRSIIKKYNPNYIIATTVLRPKMLSSEWWYLTPSTGQHISFYTKKSLAMLSKKLGCDILIIGEVVLLKRGNFTLWEKIMAGIFLTFPMRLAVNSILLLVNRNSSHRDFVSLKNDPRI